MAKRDWRRDRKLKKMEPDKPKDSLAAIVAGAGKPMYSPALEMLVMPEKGRRIDPKSPEGRAITERIKQNLT